MKPTQPKQDAALSHAMPQKKCGAVQNRQLTYVPICSIGEIQTPASTLQGGERMHASEPTLEPAAR